MSGCPFSPLAGASGRPLNAPTKQTVGAKEVQDDPGHGKPKVQGKPKADAQEASSSSLVPEGAAHPTGPNPNPTSPTTNTCPSTKPTSPRTNPGTKPTGRSPMRPLSPSTGGCPLGYGARAPSWLGGLSCVACRTLLFATVRCRPCGDVFCRACISRVKECPVCGREIEGVDSDEGTRELDRQVERFIAGHGTECREGEGWGSQAGGREKGGGEQENGGGSGVHQEGGLSGSVGRHESENVQDVRGQKGRERGEERDGKDDGAVLQDERWDGGEMQGDGHGGTGEGGGGLRDVGISGGDGERQPSEEQVHRKGGKGERGKFLFQLALQALAGNNLESARHRLTLCAEDCRSSGSAAGGGGDTAQVCLEGAVLGALGDCCRLLGDTTAAREHYKEGVACLERAEDADDDEVVHTLSVSLNKLGDLHYRAQEPALARYCYIRALAARQGALAKAEGGTSDPSPETVLAVVTSLTKVGDVERALGETAAPVERFQAAFNLTKKLGRRRRSYSDGIEEKRLSLFKYLRDQLLLKPHSEPQASASRDTA